MISVYVIKCGQTGKKYTGMTEDLNARIAQHNSGKSKFTSGYGPWKVIYCELANDWTTARTREKYLKTAAGRRFIKKIEGNPND